MRIHTARGWLASGALGANWYPQGRWDRNHLRHFSQVDGIHIMAISSKSLMNEAEELNI